MSAMAQSSAGMTQRAVGSRALTASLVGAAGGLLTFAAGYMGWIALEAGTLHANDVPMGFLTDGFTAADSTWTMNETLWFVGGLGVIFAAMLALIPRGAGKVIGIVGSIVVGATTLALGIVSAAQIATADDAILAGRSWLDFVGPGMWVAFAGGILMVVAPLFLWTRGEDRASA